ncbi:4-(cytidine 5'-diphospho)-2-C-methyl-D-erythritol kinase [Fertoebacter nigrum]|uniref:4-diphosphocytidyl-2-C-methyl-D-erythritol kinase n=1 Tax=Fertoeibacter niger TaxID=2656921 RepID=A0A8X8H355_9RHOB|nr:4-(cytidine 5'-diphospho)-2-C-methyl-D-erythritol kinase [Fertoeibacter niger]NUB44753.1 4-(cytidine 5'-diphospho)-2-C-methyl-D-erythritol kinase [Fertoeibacter niger]
MPDPGPVAVFAPAKINLTLHVTGQRADGYHLLDSLVVFADVGDWVHLAPADRLTLAITGPQAAALPVSDDNLVLRAARLMGAGGSFTLEKRLPVASGIGGGSADAAAAVRACAAARGCALPAAADVLALGADVPVCLAGRPVRMTGVGEGLEPLAHPLPAGWLVLANPGVAVPTPAVFRALARRDNAPMPGVLPQFGTLAALAGFLNAQRNDLEPPAIQIAPVIDGCKAALAAQPGCLIARMSGSGATCFGLFADERAALAAETALQAAQPGWWVAAGALRP